MAFAVRDARGQRILEGEPGTALLERAEDGRALIETCFEHATRRILLYPENLPGRFFDLSSGEAGEILQRLRNYQVRLAVVRTPGLYMSSRFGELLADEARGPYFRLFDERAAAEEWLVGP